MLPGVRPESIAVRMPVPQSLFAGCFRLGPTGHSRVRLVRFSGRSGDILPDWARRRQRNYDDLATVSYLEAS